jgi:hypothetical protein|uniref:Uncharacterized protein n=1 Tax=Podoviridae sp. ctKS020 TaxID=2826552 RepID=A0A8S5QSJ7_9CAUD|nr:MAG TPA: hypothetical protein [Podoviridae sp. ctKS020]
MVINCNVPNFAGADESTRLKKIEKYLYDLDDQLRFILSNLEVDNFTVETRSELQVGAAAKEKAQTDLKKRIDALKQKIILTAEELNTDLAETRESLTGSIQAISNQFGTYSAEYMKERVENVLGEITLFQKVEDISGYVVTSQGYIKTGELDTDESGKSIYGVEIGEVEGDSGLKLRLVKDRISFVENGYEIAYISGKELYIRQAKIVDYIYFGGYRIEVTDGIAFNWEGD